MGHRFEASWEHSKTLVSKGKQQSSNECLVVNVCGLLRSVQCALFQVHITVIGVFERELSYELNAFLRIVIMSLKKNH